ncbi:hypothetical protein D3C87_1538670 [compost metagenome]
MQLRSMKSLDVPVSGINGCLCFGRYGSGYAFDFLLIYKKLFKVYLVEVQRIAKQGFVALGFHPVNNGFYPILYA